MTRTLPIGLVIAAVSLLHPLPLASAYDCGAAYPGALPTPSPNWMSNPYGEACYYDFPGGGGNTRDMYESKCKALEGYVDFKGDFGSNRNTCIFRPANDPVPIPDEPIPDFTTQDPTPPGTGVAEEIFGRDPVADMKDLRAQAAAASTKLSEWIEKQPENIEASGQLFQQLQDLTSRAKKICEDNIFQPSEEELCDTAFDIENLQINASYAVMMQRLAKEFQVGKTETDACLEVRHRQDVHCENNDSLTIEVYNSCERKTLKVCLYDREGMSDCTGWFSLGKNETSAPHWTCEPDGRHSIEVQ